MSWLRGGKAIADYQGNCRVLELQEKEEIRGLSPGSRKGKGISLPYISIPGESTRSQSLELQDTQTSVNAGPDPERGAKVLHPKVCITQSVQSLLSGLKMGRVGAPSYSPLGWVGNGAGLFSPI